VYVQNATACLNFSYVPDTVTQTTEFRTMMIVSVYCLCAGLSTGIYRIRDLYVPYRGLELVCVTCVQMWNLLFVFQVQLFQSLIFQYSIFGPPLFFTSLIPHFPVTHFQHPNH